MTPAPPFQSGAKPLPPVSVHFLGTSAGGGPIVSRNCSSLAVDFGNDIWLFDAADGTLNRLQMSHLKMANISLMFITHMHADHVLGIVPILKTVMSGIGVSPEQAERTRALGVSKVASFHIYGPRGVRELVRTTLRLTEMGLSGAYAVHELLPRDGSPSVTCHAEELHQNEAVGKDIRADDLGVWDGILEEGTARGGKSWRVSAGPITHRVPAHGYVLQEPTPREPLDTATLIPLLTQNASALASLNPPIKHPLSLLSHLTSLPPPPPYTLPSGEVLHPPPPSGVRGRKFVIFGDCVGGTPNPRFRVMCEDASLLVHECTNAAIPEKIGRGDKGRKTQVQGLTPSLVEKMNRQGQAVGGGNGGPSHEPLVGPWGSQVGDQPGLTEKDETKRVEVRKKAEGRGHATPKEVGEFAQAIRARRVVVNHFSAMFPAPRYPTNEPFPSILSSTSPFPYPTPFPIPHSYDPPIDPIPLTRTELHTRVILQSIANQINESWLGGAAHSQMQVAGDSSDQAGLSERSAITARDFMVLRVPAHELVQSEADEMAKAKSESADVMRMWGMYGGLWVQTPDAGRRWVGVDPEPGIHREP